jgi:hypothetical protein
MKPIPKLLSKTKVMRGYRCVKSLYLTIQQPELEPPVTPALQATFDQGNAIGEEARKRFPGGVLVDNKPWDFVGALKRTRELIQSGSEIIFEGAFEYKGLFSRVDILTYSKATQRWTMLEVKSATKVKAEYLDDAGFQAYVLANSGLPLEKISILHINRDCVAPDLRNLFTEVDITQELRERHKLIGPKLTEIFNGLRQSEIPAIDIGEHCVSGTGCPFKLYCFSERKIPDVSVFNLPKIGAKAWQLYRAGQISLADIDQAGLDIAQIRMIESHLRSQRYLDPVAIQTALAGWKYPLVFLDFETINPAIPRYPGTRPYQQVPFQFSAHVMVSAGAPLKHFEYLHLGEGDPRENLIPQLLEACGEEGSIVSYYAKFESDVIRELAEQYPQYADELLALLERMVDPLPIIREAVYDVGFEGSFSLKAVAPSLLGKDYAYDGMSVADGTAAQRAFDSVYRGGLTVEQIARVREDMLEYCKLDTRAMVELVKWLQAQGRDCRF